MKQKTPQKMNYVNTDDAQKIWRLVKASCQKIEEKPLFGQILLEMEAQSNYDLIKAIKANPDIMDSLRDELKEELKEEGYTVLKAGTMEKKSKLEEFVNSVLFPYYNEQRELFCSKQ